MRFIAMTLFAVAAVSCRCGTVTKIKPSILVTPPALDFDAVKNGDTVGRTLKLEAKTNAEVVISKIELTSGAEPGGSEAFMLKTDPITLQPFGSQNFPVSFHPTALQAYEAFVTFTSNDEDHPTTRIPLLGQGSKPIMTVTLDCKPMRGCVGTVIETPPALDFGAQPIRRPTPIPANELPTVVVTNDGKVNLVITRVSITGPDAAAFTIAGGTITVPVEYEGMAGVNIPIRFVPTSEMQQSYTADLIIEGDDVDNPSVTVHLSGVLRPNAAPTVCANMIRVSPIDDSPRDYLGTWPMFLVPPAGGYDFSLLRDVEPRSTIIFSALSNATDVLTCTTDLEDGRTGLTYQWRVATVPAGSPMLGMSTTDRFTLTPIVTGDYVIELTVADAQGHSTMVPIKFAVAVKQDLAVQLQWLGYSDTDLDVHLVRPSSVRTPSDPFSGMYSFFDEGQNGRTSGDVNGYSVARQKNTAGLDFDWGAVGTPDDPKLNIDDIGTGALLENVSLNYPERDAKCDGGRCAYRVYVHYFRDYRNASVGPCTVDAGAGCEDGDQCACTVDNRCVAAPPPDGGRPVGAGECRPAPKPVVRIFLKGNPTPAATIPLPPEEILLGSPCATLYVADVNWPSQQEIGSLPDGGTPLADVFVRGLDAGLARFGKRQPGDLRQCSPDVSLTQWYSRQP